LEEQEEVEEEQLLILKLDLLIFESKWMHSSSRRVYCCFCYFKFYIHILRHLQ
jgi:hypothetical protein